MVTKPKEALQGLTDQDLFKKKKIIKIFNFINRIFTF